MGRKQFMVKKSVLPVKKVEDHLGLDENVRKGRDGV